MCSSRNSSSVMELLSTHTWADMSSRRHSSRRRLASVFVRQWTVLFRRLDGLPSSLTLTRKSQEPLPRFMGS